LNEQGVIRSYFEQGQPGLAASQCAGQTGIQPFPYMIHSRLRNPMPLSSSFLNFSFYRDSIFFDWVDAIRRES
jgi:hypothetical protein